MPREKVVPLERLYDEVANILANYQADVEESVKKTTKDIANKAAKAVRAESKAKFKGNKYRKGWTVKFKTLKKGGVHFKAVVWNKDRYRLTHLLENGHVSRNGTKRTFGFVQGRPHIGPVNDMVQSTIVRDLQNAIKLIPSKKK